MSGLRVELGIPTMNNQRTIWATLAGLADQTLPPDRVHIVDASRDWTPHIVEMFREKAEYPFELDLDRQTDGEGVGAARADIYDEFDGDLLACFDTGARPEANWLEGHVRTHEERPSIDVVSGTNDGESRFVNSPHDRGFLIQNNCTIKERAIRDVEGWDRRFDRGEDWDLAIRLWRSGATSYVRRGLGRVPLDGEGVVDRLRLRLHRPSSVRFLRKYGLWYAAFHPSHVLGDILSVVGSVAGLLALPLASKVGRRALLVLLVPFLGVLGYAGFQLQVRTHEGSELRFVLRRTPDFFLLGYTAIREILFGPRSGWNYGGLEE